MSNQNKIPESSDLNQQSQPTTPAEWKKWKQERKAKKRKWKEDKLIAKLEQEQKRKKEEEEEKQNLEEQKKNVQDEGNHTTISIALPGSILDNAQTPELRTYLAGQIARAAVVFNIDEIIIFDETGSTSDTTEGSFSGVGKKGNCNVQMARILQYLECPQYLRKAFFPQHKDLQYAGLLNPLDCPHHVKASEDSPYREGVILKKPVKEGRGSYVDVGLYKEIQVDKQLQPGIRVTVKMDLSDEGKKKQKGLIVSPSAPVVHEGLYWGYSTRLASSLSAVFTESPYSDGYDLLIGTSDKGASVDSFEAPAYKHTLIIFGGVKGLECSLDTDQDLHVDDPSLLFQHYLNTCPSQGSHTIRTEEAILISLSALRPKLCKGKKPETDS